MTRDFYKGIPKKRHALLDADGNLEALAKGGDVRVVYGSTTLSAGMATVSGSQFTADGFAFVSPQAPYPMASGISWELSAGVLTISGASEAGYTVAYQVVIP